jgi:hypothetical protein
LNAAGVKCPAIALLDHTEQVTEKKMKVPSIADAFALETEFLTRTDCAVEGPMAYDIAVYPNGASAKGYKPRGKAPRVAGNPDVLFMPDELSGRLRWNKLGLPWKACDISWGGLAPVLVPSRSDSVEHKWRSIILSAYLIEQARKEKKTRGKDKGTNPCCASVARPMLRRVMLILAIVIVELGVFALIQMFIPETSLLEIIPLSGPMAARAPPSLRSSMSNQL